MADPQASPNAGQEPAVPDAAAQEAAIVAQLEAAEAAAKPAGETAEPTAPGVAAEPAGAGAVNWEQILQRASSAVAHQKELPVLPEGATVEAAPEYVRAALTGFGYKAPEAGGGKPEAAPVAPPVEYLAPAILQTDTEYQAEVHEAMSNAATREERVAALKEVNTRYAETFLERAVSLLETAGHDVDGLSGTELFKALEGIPGLVLPTDETDPVQALGFLLTVKQYAKTTGGLTRETVAAEVAKAMLAERSKWEKDLATLADHTDAATRIGNGDLVTAAGVGVGAEGHIPSEREVDGMTPERLAEMEAKEPGTIDKILANINRKK
jgi:hypothetical protein